MEPVLATSSKSTKYGPRQSERLALGPDRMVLTADNSRQSCQIIYLASTLLPRPAGWGGSL